MATTFADPRRPPALVLTLLLAWVVPAGLARGAEPVDQALRLVPDDSAICVVVRDLRTHAANVSRSPFVAWLKDSPLFAQFGDPEDLQKLRDLERFLDAQFGATPTELLDDVFGDAVVFAYQPGPPGKPEQESGVVLVRPRKPELLLRVIEKLNLLQQQSGELRSVQKKTYRERPYVVREKSAGGSEYYYLENGVLAFSGSERALERVIDQDLSAPGVADRPPPVTKALRSMGMAGHLAVCWFNPRGFDAELTAKLDAAKEPGERAFLTRFRDVWTAVDGVALYAHPDTGLDAGVVVSVRRSDLPAEIREFLAPTAEPSSLWSAVPDDAILAISGRVSLARLLRAVSTFLPPEGQEGLKKALEGGVAPLVGRDRLPRLLEAVGPDWAAWVTPPPPGAGAWMPDWTFAVKLSADQELADAVTQVLDFGVSLMRIDYNRKHSDQIDFHQETRDGVTVKILTNREAFPTGFRPSYAVKDGHLVLASSPETLLRFNVTGEKKSQGGSRPLVRISAGLLREYLGAHKETLARMAARDGNRPQVEIEQDLARFTSILGALDRIELHQVGDGKTLRVSMQVRFVKPLK